MPKVRRNVMASPSRATLLTHQVPVRTCTYHARHSRYHTDDPNRCACHGVAVHLRLVTPRVTMPWALLVALMILGTAMPPSVALSEALQPAQFNRQSDNLGFNWDVQQNGMINNGNNDCFDGGLMLMIDNHGFNPNQPAQMTADGEFILTSNNINGMHITRRVKVMPEHGLVRYLEIITNNDQQRTAEIKLRTQLGNSAQRVITSEGSNAAGNLDRRSFGILCQAQPGSRPSVAMLLSGHRPAVRATINNQHNRTIEVSWKLKLKPNQRAVIYHAVAQRQANTLNTKALPELFEPIYRNRLTDRDLPPDIASDVVNFTITAGEGEPLLEMRQALFDSRMAAAGKEDTVFLQSNGGLSGTVSTEDGQVTMASRLGQVTVPLEQVAAVVGGAGKGRRHQLLLTNGEVIAGQIQTPSFTLASKAGFSLSFVPDQVSVVVRAGVQPKADAQAVGFIDTGWGDRLAVAAEDGRVPMTTPWGGIAVAVTELHQLNRAIDPPPGMRLILGDGTRLAALPGTSAIAARTLRFGPIELSPEELVGFRRKQSETTLVRRIDWTFDRADPPAKPHCRMLGGNRIVGQIELDDLPLQINNSATTVAAERIKAFEKVDNPDAGTVAEPVFRFTFTDGGTVQGHFGRATIPLRRGETLWHLPVRQLEGGRFAPAPTDASPGDEEAADSSNADEAEGNTDESEQTDEAGDGTNTDDGGESTEGEAQAAAEAAAREVRSRSQELRPN